MTVSDEKLVWIDTETFGLIPEDCPIIEIGILITDLELNEIAKTEQTIWEPWYETVLDDLKFDSAKYKGAAKYVYDMHQSSGLWDLAKKTGVSIEQTQSDLTWWLKEQGVSKLDPMCGSSVQFDRLMLAYHMPAVHDIFSYRNIDNSTLKELCRRYNPILYSKLEEETKPKKAHRVISDLYDTVAEFRFYRDNFLFWKD